MYFPSLWSLFWATILRNCYFFYSINYTKYSQKEVVYTKTEGRVYPFYHLGWPCALTKYFKERLIYIFQLYSKVVLWNFAIVSYFLSSLLTFFINLDLPISFSVYMVTLVHYQNENTRKVFWVFDSAVVNRFWRSIAFYLINVPAVLASLIKSTEVWSWLIRSASYIT